MQPATQSLLVKAGRVKVGDLSVRCAVARQAARPGVHRCYVTREAIAAGYDSCTVKSVPAADVEAAVLAQVQRLLTTPEMIARTWTATKGALDEREALGRLADFGSL